jgi:hypothetical protein
MPKSFDSGLKMFLTESGERILTPCGGHSVAASCQALFLPVASLARVLGDGSVDVCREFGVYPE